VLVVWLEELLLPLLPLLLPWLPGHWLRVREQAEVLERQQLQGWGLLPLGLSWAQV
jgi:hypothetical protein